jgi:hypothetical protein
MYWKSGDATNTDDPIVPVNGNWWGAGDTSPEDGGSSRAYSSVDAIPDGSRCGSKTADVLHSSHYNDWGSLFGYNVFKSTGADAYEGISFWARSPGNTTKGFAILLDDANNNSSVAGSNCKPVDADGGTVAESPGSGWNPATGTLISGSGSAAPLPDQCGNDYSVTMSVTSDWRFYTIPFSAFQQANTPNRVPNAVLTEVGNVPGTGLLTSKLRSLVIRMPKEAEVELWIDNLAFYKKTGQPDTGASGDAGQR